MIVINNRKMFNAAKTKKLLYSATIGKVEIGKFDLLTVAICEKIFLDIAELILK